MKVKARYNINCSDGWHMTGEVFETSEDLGEAVEVLDAPKKTEAKPQEPVKEPEKAEEPGQEAQKSRNANRRRKASE